MHGFGTSIGLDLGLLPFHQYWLKARQAGRAQDIGAYSVNTVAAPQGKFMPSATDVPPTSPLANIAYAYHFDAGLYARYLRAYSEARGVRRTEGLIEEVGCRRRTASSSQWAAVRGSASPATCSSIARDSADC